MKQKIIEEYFSYDSKVSLSFLTDYQKGLRNFFIVALLGYVAYATLDFFEKYYIGLALRIIIITLCIIPITVNLRKMHFERMKFFSNLSIFLLFILEIETQIQAIDIPFYHSSAWFADIIIMLIHSMYFLGTPLHYSLFWFILICYYFFRTYLTVSGNIHHAITNAWLYHFVTWLFGSVFNTWWFRTRYTNTINDIRYKEEYEKRIVLENELTRVRERESIFADIHDNLGGKLLDLSFQLKGLKTDTLLSAQSKEKIEITIYDVLKGLRNRLLIFEDMSKIEEDFIKGLNYFLLRRYSLAERKVQFDIGLNYRDGLIPKGKYTSILSIISELVNNDLKYGFGVSVWGMFIENDQFLIQLHSCTHWIKDKTPSGNGQQTIHMRVMALDATFSDKVDNGMYSAELTLPTN